MRDAVLKEKIMEVWSGEKGRKVYGARKIWLELNSQGVSGGAVHGRAADARAGHLRGQSGAEAAAGDAARRSRGPAL